MANLRKDLPGPFLANVMSVLHDLDLGFDDFWPRVEGDEAYYLVNCNDYFHYAAADAEPLTEGDWGLFYATAVELDKMGESSDSFPELYLAHLYAARRRGQRPLTERMYGHTYASGGKIDPMPPEVLALFEAIVTLGDPDE